MRPSALARIVSLPAALSLAALAASGAATPAHAQGPGAAAVPREPAAGPALPVPTLPDGSRQVRGRVVLLRDTTRRPVPNAWVTLHRVGQDSAGPLDSLRTDARGGFAFRYRPTGDPEAIYFAATEYGGIAYFTPPLRAAVVDGEGGEVAVFDTTSAPVPISVRGRHLIVAAPKEDGTRNVIEVFEVSNDSTVTGVPPNGSPRGSWSVALPAGARNFAVRPGDIPTDGMTAANGRALLLVPFAPGLRQVAFSYTIAADALPLVLAVERPVGVMEVLLVEPKGTVTGAGLAPVQPVTLEGRTFQRHLARDLKAGARIEVSYPEGARRWEQLGLIGVLAAIGGAMVVVLLRSSARQGGAAPGSGAVRPVPSAAPARDADALLAALAALDDAFAARPEPTPAERARYEREREDLKSQLVVRLADAESARR